MRLISVSALCACVGSSALAEANALECEVLTRFFQLYEAKASIADQELLAAIQNAPLSFEASEPDSNGPSSVEQAAMGVGISPDALRQQIETVAQFRLLLDDRCGR